MNAETGQAAATGGHRQTANQYGGQRDGKQAWCHRHDSRSPQQTAPRSRHRCEAGQGVRDGRAASEPHADSSPQEPDPPDDF